MLPSVLTDAASRTRDLLLFLALALLPTVAVGVLGFRALEGEEAAQRREVQAALGASAERIRLRVEQALGEADSALVAAKFDADERKAAEGLLKIAPPFAVPVVLGKNRELLVPAAPPEARVAERSSFPCEARAAEYANSRDEAARKAARQLLLSNCGEARGAGGRFLYPVIALEGISAADVEEFVVWIEAHAALLSRGEREATREEISGAKVFPEALKARALAALDSSPSEREKIVAALRSEAAGKVLREGPDRAGMLRFRSEGALGLLRALEDGRIAGLVVDAESLGKAFSRGWPDLPADQKVFLGTKGGNGPRASTTIAPSLIVEVVPSDPLAIEKRASRSRRLLAALGASAVVLSLGLLAVLWARIRAARRTSELRVDFVSAISHELRTPASSVRMFSELLRGGHIEPEEQREIFEALERESKRLSETIERMLSLGRMSKGKLEAVRAKTDVSAVLNEVVDAFEARFTGDTSVERDIEGKVSASLDAGLIRLAVDNLLDNARKYAPEGLPYRVVLKRGPGRIVIRVEDKGPGISRRNRKRIFLPFERIDDKLSRSTEGSGLGLALVKRVAEAHGGSAGVESEIGKGASFVLAIPVTNEGTNEEKT